MTDQAQSIAQSAGTRAAVPAHPFRPVLIAVLFGAVLIAAGPFLIGTYAVNILIRAFFYAIVALTLDILWGFAGILTFGQAAFFGVGAYAAALVFTHMGFTGQTILLAIVLAAAAPAVLGLIVGWLSFYNGSTPLYASVISLAFPIIVTQAIFSGGTFTGSSSGLVGYESFDFSLRAWFWIAGGALVLCTGFAAIFMRSEMGRVITAMRDNEMRCAYLGLNVPKLKILLTAGLAAVAGLAGLGYAGFSGVVAPELTGFVFGTQLVIYVALGGRATLIGPVLGAVAIEVASAYLSGDLPFIWQLIIGLVFVLVIIALPNGLASLFTRALGGIAPKRPAASYGLAVAGAAAGDARAASVEIDGVARSFGSLKVLEGIDLSIRGGELVSLVGPNGAGKTTLMRAISDGTERSAGTVRINGHDIGRAAPARIVGFGLGRKFQTANIFETLSVGECLRIARFRADPPSLWRPLATLALPPAARGILETTGLVDKLGVRASLLSHGQKQALELAMVLALEPSVVLLDEPTAGLTKVDRTRIGTMLVALARDYGLAIILVEHDLGFVRDISSRVVVLNQGQIVLDGSVTDVVGSELVRSIYAGAGHV